MPATFTAKFNFGYGWFLGEDPGTEPLDYQTKAIDALMLDAFGQDIATTAGLTYGYRGGWIYHSDTRLPFHINNATILLPANSVSYVQRNEAGTIVSANSFLINNMPMAVVTTNNFEITNIVDARVVSGSFSNLVKSVFTRIGDITAASGDYSADLIALLTPLSNYPSADNVQEALGLINTDIASALSGGVLSFSPIGGSSRTGNIFAQYGDYSADIVATINVIPGIDLTGVANPSVEDALGAISIKAGVWSFNSRVGDIYPVATDYPASFVPYNNVLPMVPLLPSGVTTGSKVQGTLDAFKQHFHDATQIKMNPVIVTGKDTVQKMLQWLYDNSGGGNSGSGDLAITTPDYSYSGASPYSFDLTLAATGGTGPYSWTYVSGNVPGDPADGAALATGHLVVTGIGSPGVYSATVKVTDSTPTTPLELTATITITLTAAAAAPVITSFSADPISIVRELGDPPSLIYLEWTVSGADSLSINNNVGVVTTSPAEAYINSTTTYTLTATNANGSTTATAIVTVHPGIRYPTP